jgi:PAS domain S-box-containing protein
LSIESRTKAKARRPSRAAADAPAELAALRESEEKFRRIAEGSPFGLGTYDREQRVLFTNSRLTELTGWSQLELPRVADWFEQLYPDPRYRQKVEAQWNRDIAQVRRGRLRQSPVRAYRVQCRDGSVKDLEITFALEKDLVHAVFIDITERKRTEEALRAATEFMRALLDFAPMPIYVRDAEHRYRLVNREWERVFRRKRAEVIGRAIDEVLPPELADYLERTNRKVLATRRAISTEESIDFPEGRRIYHTMKFPLRNAEGEVDSVGGISIDMTQRIRAEQEILRLNDELEQRVADRTAELAAANRELRSEIAERLRLQTELLEISEREQRRLGQDLHDELGQQLTGLGMMAAVLERQLREEKHPRARFAAELGEMLQRAVTTTRDLARGFYPVVLEQGGLLAALQDLAHRTEVVAGVRCVVRHRPTFHFPRSASIHLYRIAQEALSNAVRHGSPRTIQIELGAQRGVSRLRIVNDGPRYTLPPPGKRGFGLSIMRYRARLIDAAVTVGPGPRGGCEVVCVLEAREERREKPDDKSLL